MQQDSNKQAEDDQLTAAYQRVFMGKSTAQEGQLVFWDLINQSYLFRSFGQQNASAYAMEGKREIGIEIMTRVNLMPNLGDVHPQQVIEDLKDTINNVDKFKKTAK